MIKMNYTSKITKQGYRRNRDGTDTMYFESAMIGVLRKEYLYADSEMVANGLISKWNKDIYFEYSVINIEDVKLDSMPPNSYVHDTVSSGRFYW